MLVECGSGFDIIYKCFTISIPIKIFIEAMTYWIAVDTCMSLSAKLSIYKFEDRQLILPSFWYSTCWAVDNKRTAIFLNLENSHFQGYINLWTALIVVIPNRNVVAYYFPQWTFDFAHGLTHQWSPWKHKGFQWIKRPQIVTKWSLIWSLSVTLGSCTLLLYIKDTEPKTSDDGS